MRCVTPVAIVRRTSGSDVVAPVKKSSIARRIVAVTVGVFVISHAGAALADSHGQFPGRGSLADYNRSCERSDMAKHLAATGDLKGAIKADSESISIYPYDSAAYVLLGLHLNDDGRLEDAISTYKLALSLEPEFPDALFNMGCTYWKMHKHEEAERQYRKAIKLEPTHYKALVNLGELLTAEHKLAEAKEVLLRAQALPEDKIFPDVVSNDLEAIDQQLQQQVQQSDKNVEQNSKDSSIVKDESQNMQRLLDTIDSNGH
jgi:tetratricopeptide (TPR) repeat protein